MSDGGMAGRRDDDLSVPLIAQRLEALEHRVDSGFKQLDHRLDNLGFVRSDVYGERNIALEQRLQNIEADVIQNRDTAKRDSDDAAKPGRWALGVIGSGFLLILIGVIVQVALELVKAS